jgi:acetolactate synthase-1/2/3 large subunit
VEKSDATQELLQFAETYTIPVATTLRGKGVFPEDHPLSLGIFGYDGTRHAIEGILSEKAGVLLILGSGLNQRDTLFWSKHFNESRTLIQVDNNPSVIGSTYKIDLPIAGDCGSFLEELNTASTEKTQTLLQARSKREEWIARIRATGSRLYDEENCASDAVPIHPARVVRDLRNVMPRDTILLVDSGAHRAFCGHYWESYAPREYISATNLGPMGWAIPAAVGVKMACPDKPCAVVTGDGCMLMHGMEIQTASRYNADITYVVINNSALGNVYLRAKQYGPKAAVYTELPTHNWAAFAESLGVKGIRISEPDNLTAAFEQAMATQGPVLVEVMCGKDYPTPVTPYSESQKEWFNNA